MSARAAGSSSVRRSQSSVSRMWEGTASNIRPLHRARVNAGFRSLRGQRRFAPIDPKSVHLLPAIELMIDRQGEGQDGSKDPFSGSSPDEIAVRGAASVLGVQIDVATRIGLRKVKIE